MRPGKRTNEGAVSKAYRSFFLGLVKAAGNNRRREESGLILVGPVKAAILAARLRKMGNITDRLIKVVFAYGNRDVVVLVIPRLDPETPFIFWPVGAEYAGLITERYADAVRKAGSLAIALPGGLEAAGFRLPTARFAGVFEEMADESA